MLLAALSDMLEDGQKILSDAVASLGLPGVSLRFTEQMVQGIRTSRVEVLEEMKKLSPRIKAIMLTGYPTLETARQALDLGANAYCVKPIDKNELESTVAAVLTA